MDLLSMTIMVCLGALALGIILGAITWSLYIMVQLLKAIGITLVTLLLMVGIDVKTGH